MAEFPFFKGDDDVIACKVSGNSGSVERYYNIGRNGPSYINASNPSLGLSNGNIIYNSTGLICSFRRDKATNGQSEVFDLNNNYYILIASGSLSSCNIFI